MGRSALRLLILTGLLSGCMATGTKVDESLLPTFVKGETTYYDIVASLGKPNQSTLYPDGSRQVSYVYVQSQAKVQNFIPIVSMFAQGATAETTQVLFDFDPRGVLLTYTSTQGQTTMGTGLLSGGKQ